jgi:hypothetical protein
VPYQQELVARLAGAEPLPPSVGQGITLTDRATLARRTAARDYLAAELDALGLESRLHTYETGTNVWAALPATRPGAGTLVQTTTGGTDHVSFREVGFWAVGITESTSPETPRPTTTRPRTPTRR